MELTDEGASYRRGTTGFAYYVPSQPTELCPSTGPSWRHRRLRHVVAPGDTSGELIEGTALRIDWTPRWRPTPTTALNPPAGARGGLPPIVFGARLDTVDRVDATAECSAGDLTITAAIRRLSEDETTPLYLAVPTIDAKHLNEVGLLGGGGEGVIAESSARDCGKVLSATVSGVEVSAEMVAAPPDCCNGSHYVAALFSRNRATARPPRLRPEHAAPRVRGRRSARGDRLRTSRHPVASVGVRTSLNAQQFSAAPAGRHTPPARRVPRAALRPRRRQPTVDVRGNVFRDGSHLLCNFSSLERSDTTTTGRRLAHLPDLTFRGLSNATLRGDDTLRCVSPLRWNTTRRRRRRTARALRGGAQRPAVERRRRGRG